MGYTTSEFPPHAGRVMPIDDEKKQFGGQLLVALVAVVLIVLALTVALTLIFAANQIGHPWAWERPGQISPEQWQNHIRNAATIVGVPGIAAALVFSYFRQRTNDRAQEATTKSLSIQSSDQDARRLTDLRARYTSAAELLGGESQAMRVAGVHALVSLADDWHLEGNMKERQVCIDLLMSLLASGEQASHSTEAVSPEQETILRAVLDRVRTTRVSERWTGAELTVRGIILDQWWPGVSLDFSNLRFESPVRHLLMNSSDLHRTNVEFKSAAPSCLIKFDLCDFTSGHINFELSPSDAEYNSDWDVHFNGCGMGGIRLTLAGEGSGSTGYRFESCGWGTDMPLYFPPVDPTSAPLVDHLIFDNCDFSADILAGANLDRFRRVSFIGGRALGNLDPSWWEKYAKG